MRELIITFDGPPGPISSKFLDVEDAATGESVSIEWNRLDHDLYGLGPFVAWDESKELQDENERLKAALKRYGRHDSICRFYQPMFPCRLPLEEPCTCGLEEAQR